MADKPKGKGAEGDGQNAYSASPASTASASPASSTSSAVRRRKRSHPRPPIRSFNLNMSSVLNDPRQHARDKYDLFTRDWGEGFVVPSSIPHPQGVKVVTAKLFRKYLEKYSESIKAHENAVKSPRSSRRRNDADVASAQLKKIPAIFFRADFDLTKPKTFQQVICTGPSSRLKQEELSSYLDIVEMQLSTQISRRSDRFFGAITTQEALIANVQEGCQKIASFRARLGSAKKVISDRNVAVLQHARSRANYSTLESKLKYMAAVSQTQASIQQLLASSEFVLALDLIATTQAVLRDELKGIHCLRHLGSQLKEIESSVEKMMENELVVNMGEQLKAQVPIGKIITTEVGEDADEVVANDEKLEQLVLGLLRQHNNTFLDLFGNEVSTYLKSLIRQVISNHFGVVDGLAEAMRALAFDTWLELLGSLFEKLKSIVAFVAKFHTQMQKFLRRFAPETAKIVEVSEARAKANRKLSSPLRGISTHSGPVAAPPNHEGNSANGNGNSGYPSPTSSVRSSSQYRDVDGDFDDFEIPENAIADADLSQLDATATAGDPGVTAEVGDETSELITPEEYAILLNTSAQVLSGVCEQAHFRMSKLIASRAKSGGDTSLAVASFVEFFKMAHTFILTTEQDANCSCSDLRSAVLSWAKRFLDQFHTKQKELLSLLLANERWTKAEVPAECQIIVDEICQITEKGEYLRPTENQKLITISGQQFYVVGASLMYFRMIAEYMRCSTEMPILTSDISSRLFDILRLFNQQAKTLILQAEAIKLVGLKSINAKQLALSAQQLSAIITLIPILRSHLQTFLPDRMEVLLSEFNKIKNDYADHRHKLFDKLVSMIGDQWRRSFKDMTWHRAAKTDGVARVATQTAKLHNALSSVLPLSDIEVVFRDIVLLINKRLREVCIQDAKNNKSIAVGLAADVVELEEKLQSLAGVPVEELRTGLTNLVLPTFIKR